MRRGACWLLLVALGIAAGSSLLAARLVHSSSASLGIPPGNVLAVEGTLTEDSRLTARGLRLYRVSIDSVTGMRGGRTSARGSLLAVAAGGPALPMGAPFSVRCSVKKALWPIDFVAYANGPIRESEPADPALRLRAAVKSVLLDSTAAVAEGATAQTLRGALTDPFDNPDDPGPGEVAAKPAAPGSRSTPPGKPEAPGARSAPTRKPAAAPKAVPAFPRSAAAPKASILLPGNPSARPWEAPAKGLFRAMLLGVTDDLGASENESFRRAGCIHVLSLSGEHLSILAALLAFLLRPLVGKRKGVIIGALLIGSYVFLIGPQPALLRSAIMYGFFAAAFLFRLPGRSLQALALAFVILSLVNQEAAVSLSSQLSFLSLFGIMTVGQRLSRRVRPWAPEAVAVGLSASVGALLFTAPVSAAVFGAVYPIGILASLATAPIVTAFMWTGFAYLAFAPIAVLTPLAAVVETAMEAAYRALMAVMDFFAQVPSLELKGGEGIAVTLAALASSLVLLYVMPYHRFLRTDRASLDSSAKERLDGATGF